MDQFTSAVATSTPDRSPICDPRHVVSAEHAEQLTGDDMQNTSATANELQDCPKWCTDHRSADDGYSAHAHRIVATLPAWSGTVDVYGSRDLGHESDSVRDPGPVAYVLEDDAQLSASELRALSTALLEAADLMDSINAKAAA